MRKQNKWSNTSALQQSPGRQFSLWMRHAHSKVKYEPKFSINEEKKAHTHKNDKNELLNKTETLMNEFKSVYLSLSFWHSLGKQLIYCKYHNGICQCYIVWTTFSQKSGPRVIKKKTKKKLHAHKQTMMRLFEFLTFYYSFLLFTVFFLKEAVHQRAFCSYSYFFTEENTVQPFFFLLKTISGGISSTHIIIPYIKIIYFQCQAQEIIHDQCVHSSVVHIHSI